MRVVSKLGPQGKKGDQGKNGVPYDSGWQDLLGFAFYGVGIKKPQYRRYGNIIKFRGIAVVPLADAGRNLITFDSDITHGNTYVNKLFVGPYVGTGGVTLVTSGNVQWNNGQSVLPASLIGSGSGKVDGSYSKLYTIGFRRILSQEGVTGIIYNGAFNLSISPAGILKLQTIKDDEEEVGGQTLGYSALRFITSMAKVGGYPQLYNDLNGGIDTIHSVHNNAPVQWNVTQDDVRHAVDLDAGSPNQIGGFTVVLDGLEAMLNP